LSFTVTATDLDNDTIKYFINNTANFTINSSSGNTTLNLSGTGNFSGTIYLAINASDGLANASELVFVNITAINDTPTIFPISNVTVNETDFANITAVADDGDSDLLNFTINDTLRFNFTTKNQSAANFSWKTNLTDSGAYQFRVNVTDFNSSSIGFFNVSVVDRPDFDGDGIPDVYDSDDDNDGIADGEDSVLGNVTTINSSTIPAAAFNVTVNSSVNLSRILNGTFFVNVTNGTRSLVEFFWNFSQSNLSLNFTVDVQNSTAAFGGILVKGLRLQQNQTKNITVQNVNSTINSTCIKDADVASLDNISGNCKGANETLVQCPGVFGSYNCSLSDDGAYYKITGANFTAAKEQCADSDADGYYDSTCGSGTDCDDGRAGVNPGTAEVCGNGLDDDCSGGDAVCPSTQVSGGGGGGGGGGGAATPALGAGTLAKVSQVFTAIGAGETAVMRINKSSIAFTKVRFTAAAALSSISMDVELLNSSNVSAPLLLPSAERFAVYQYFRVTSKLTFLDISDAGIEFRVPKDWLSGSGFGSRQVFLYRYSGGSWDRMRTVLFSEDSNYSYYSAELPAFSLFAVAAEEAKAPAAAVAGNESAQRPQNITVVAAANGTAGISRGEMAERLLGKKGKLIIAVVVAALLLFAVVFVINARRLKEREHVSDELSNLFRKARK
ncbi:PGF-pre-PGF domain-containing protein, partial [Candidatus Woesearchaeota archaeon]|nr:PGF-pre-PGF domain-containing protein [Candidatus Woesearchaeota archaeon]